MALLPCLTWAQTSAEQQVASAFATSLVLTDSEAVTFGLLSFDPDELPGFGDGAATAESLSRRRSVRTYTLPANWTFDDGGEFTPHIKARLNYLQAKQDVVVPRENGDSVDRNEDRVYGGYVEGGFSYRFNDSWHAELGLGLHALQYDNRFEGDSAMTDLVDPALNPISSNTHATALIGEIQPRLAYSSSTLGLPWKFKSTYSYYVGDTVRTDQGLAGVQPETWSWANGVTLHWPLDKIFGTSNQLRLLARRVDVGGDVEATLGTRQYYEFGIGWLFHTPNAGWLNNIGLSLSFNTGSALSGGSAVLLYNEEY